MRVDCLRNAMEFEPCRLALVACAILFSPALAAAQAQPQAFAQACAQTPCSLADSQPAPKSSSQAADPDSLDFLSTSDADSPFALQSPAPDQTPAPEPDLPPVMFGHFNSSRFWLSGQSNFIFQAHEPFHALYSGTNSFHDHGETALSRVLDLYTGVRISSNSALVFNLEETGGDGLSNALGIAGFTNLDVVRNPQLSKAPYVARLFWDQIIPLSSKRIDNPIQGPFSIFKTVPERRLEIRFGKLSLVDFFDLNSYGTDSHFQFMNWTVDNNGAYDYAANTRGYTDAAMFEYHDLRWAIRFAEALMPKVANGDYLDADLARARSENVEFEWDGSLLHGKQGAIRLLSYVNHANMGLYSQAVANYLDGATPTPEITFHPLQTTIKYGFGGNFEQGLTSWLGVFGRWGWNEGQHESFAYTEVDATVLFGLGASGSRWHRKWDRAGIAYVSNGISRDHQQYLALGGLGFLLGDGALNYGREDIIESYYTLHAWRGLYTSFDMQYIDHPGYNKDRGPVFVPSIRLNVQF
jgi:high affinity Mn2+ porin